MVNNYFDISNGEVRVWIEQESCIVIHAVTKLGDPVELSSGEARKLAAILLEFSEKIS